MKQVTVLGLVIIIIFSLTSCGVKDGEVAQTEQLSGSVYLPVYTDLNVPSDYVISTGCSDGKNVYFAGQYYMQETQMTCSSVNCIPVDGGATEVIMDSANVGDDTNYAIDSVGIGTEGTLWVFEQRINFQFDLPGDFNIEADSKWRYSDGNSTRTALLRQIDTSGKELYCTDITEQLETYIFKVSIDADGNCYIAYNGKLVVLDKNGNRLFEIEDNTLINDAPPVRFSDGSMGILCRIRTPGTEESTYVVRELDLGARGWGKTYELPYVGINSNYDIYDGSGKYLFCFVIDDDLYGWTSESGEPEKIMSWMSTGVSYLSVVLFGLLPDGQAIALTQGDNWEGDGWASRLVVLSETDTADVPERKVLTYAAMLMRDDERKMLLTFNNSQQEYYIEAKDYAVYNTPSDPLVGYKVLTTEITAGKIPDILNTAGLPMSQYAAKGLLEDLWPYIDNDPEIGREQLMTHVLECDAIDGKLYEVFDAFDIRTVAGAKDVVGDRMGWTPEELQSALDTMPEGCTAFYDYYTKAAILSEILSYNQEKYVNWNTGECRFDSEDFKTLLEFCNGLSPSFDWNSVGGSVSINAENSKISQKEQMLMQHWLTNLVGMQELHAVFGGDVSFVGYPTADGSVGSRFSTSGYCMAISTKCTDKEGAWRLVRQLLLPNTFPLHSVSFDHGFPINKEAFNKRVSREMEDGVNVSDNSAVVHKIQATQKEYDQFMELYNAINMMYRVDYTIIDIVQEQAGAYFAGDKFLDETVDLIQGRVELYVNEQR